jgi:hypothetical protein
VEGVSRTELGGALLPRHDLALRDAEERGLIERGDTIRLTAEGRVMANEVLAALLP